MNSSRMERSHQPTDFYGIANSKEDEESKNGNSVPLKFMTSTTMTTPAGRSTKDGESGDRGSHHRKSTTSKFSLFSRNSLSRMASSESAHTVLSVPEMDPDTTATTAAASSTNKRALFRRITPTASFDSSDSVRSKKPIVPRGAGSSGDDIDDASPGTGRRKTSSSPRVDAAATAGSMNTSPTNSTPTTPVGGGSSSSGKGHRFRFPAVKMGGFLFRKKSSWPTLNYGAAAAAAATVGGSGSGTDEDRNCTSPSSATSSNRGKQKKQKGKRSKGGGGTSGENTPNTQRSPTFYNNLVNGGGSGNTMTNETSPLLKRINNRLNLDRINRFSTASYPSSYQHHHQQQQEDPDATAGGDQHAACSARYKRCGSKEDPGPRTNHNHHHHFSPVAAAAAVAAGVGGPVAALMAEVAADAAACSSSSNGGGSNACNKSASYPTAFGLDGKWGIEDGAYTLNTSTKYKLVKEGQIQVCRLNHPRTLLGKLTSSKLLRRWETHTLVLDSDEITSKTPSGFMEHPIKYSTMEDIHALPHWDSSGDKHCVRIFVPDGSILLQTNHVYARNQWLFSIQWRRNLYRYRRVIESNCCRPEVILKEIKSMVELTIRTPLQGDHMSLKPVRLVCMVLKQISDGLLPKTMVDPVVACAAPILDTIAAVSEISPWLIKYCEEYPRSRLINDVLSDVGHLTLKKNMDFGIYTSARLFVQEFLLAMSTQNDGFERVKSFVRSAHGTASSCPHPRVLQNLVSVCLAAIHALYDSSYGGGGGACTNGTITKASTSPSTIITASQGGGARKQQPQHLDKQRTCRIPMISMNSLLCGDISSLSSGGSTTSSDDRHSIAPSLGGRSTVGGGGVGAATASAGEPSCVVVSSPSIISSSLSGIVGRYAAPPLRERSGSAESQTNAEQRLLCFCGVLETMSEFEDWRIPLASMLQPVPFPDEVLSVDAFAEPFGRLIRRIGSDQRCEVHLSVLAVREGKDGWFNLVCPGGPCFVDDGDLFASLLKTLLHCCCRRKKFLQSLNAMLGPLQLLSLRECEPAMEALCHMLEMEVVEGEDMKFQIITALQSTSAGKRQYADLCERQIALRELQQKGGPRKLTLPSNSTDADLAVLLSSGSFGNLEWLSLAFTSVTSACAEYLIKLPSLRYLNLWSTKFGDLGLQTISEHLHKLQVLNLCETPVSDKGLASLSALSKLRKLNLNSTNLSAKTFQMLKAKLPELQDVDVRYTDAWCPEEFLDWSP